MARDHDGARGGDASPPCAERTADWCQFGHAKWASHSPDHSERNFLAGPGSRLRDLGRVLRIAGEFVRGFRAFRGLPPTITVFGSARFDESHRYYQMARTLGGRLASEGFAVMTGGGPGIMEDANRGATDAQGVSVGCNIVLPHEQKPNPYVQRWAEFRHFFVRKVMLLKHSVGFVALPGGFGTFDEVFETATLIQTGKVYDFPIILMGRDYWDPMFGFLRDSPLAGGAIDPLDLERLTLTDDVDAAVHCLRECAVRRFGQTLPIGNTPGREG